MIPKSKMGSVIAKNCAAISRHKSIRARQVKFCERCGKESERGLTHYHEQYLCEDCLLPVDDDLCLDPWAGSSMLAAASTFAIGR